MMATERLKLNSPRWGGFFIGIALPFPNESTKLLIRRFAQFPAVRQFVLSYWKFCE